jgi:molecular chaperone DnaK (HSP70)
MRRFLLAGILCLAACKKEARPPSLAEAVSVEQPGGSVTELIGRGSEIPTSATESFTTSRDDERRVAVHVLRGAGRVANKLHSDGWWVVDGVAAGKAGEPRVLVTLEVDAQGALSVSARQEERKLKVSRAEGDGKLKPSPLTEPDDGEDTDDDAD